MDKYLEYQKEQVEKSKKQQDQLEKKQEKLCELFEFIIPKVFRYSESLLKQFEFRNERKTFGDDFAEFKSDVICFREYDVKDENGEPIVEEEHFYTLTIKIFDNYKNFENMLLTLEHVHGAAPSEYLTDFLTIDEKGFQDALSQVFIRMEEHRFR